MGALGDGLLSGADLVESMSREASRRLSNMVRKCRTAGISATSEVLVGNVFTEIRRALQSYGPDLIAMGTHGRQGVDRWFMGSVTERLLRQSSVPMFTVSNTKRPGRDVALFHRILVATDFADGTVDALRYAFSIARENDASITLLHVIEAPVDLPFEDREKMISDASRNLVNLIPREAENWCDVRTQVDVGTAYQKVLEMVRKAKFDLLVLNIHGKGLLERLLFGSSAEPLVRAAGCPVMLVPAGSTASDKVRVGRSGTRKSTKGAA
jgi:nucleotide-binding universal stress UspA family protein